MKEKYDKRIYLTSVSGTGKTTFKDMLLGRYPRLHDAGNIAQLAEAGYRIENIMKRGYSFDYARQSARYHYTKERMSSRETTKMSKITIYERTMFDWMLGSITHTDPIIRGKFLEFLRYLRRDLPSQEYFWARTCWIQIPAPSLAVIEKNFDNFFTGKRGEWYDKCFGFTDASSKTHKCRVLHESMMESEFTSTELIRGLMPHNHKEMDCHLIEVRKIPAYLNLNLSNSTYFEWQKITESAIYKFLEEL